MRASRHCWRGDWRAGWRSLCWLLTLTGLGGCSVQMAYNNLDRLARWSVSDYVTMEPAQRAVFDAEFHGLWNWHRREHLPAYASFLDGVSARLGDTTTEAEMQALVDQIIGWAQEIELRALPMAAELLGSLSDAQVSALAEAMEQSNQEIAEPEVDASLSEAQALWRDEFIERFSEFAGRLNTVQRAYLEAHASGYRPERLLWVDYRRRWQRDFLALLAHREDLVGLAAGLRGLSTRRELYYGPELTAVYQHNVRLVREASVWLMNSLTRRQLERFEERLQDLADDFRALAAQ